MRTRSLATAAVVVVLVAFAALAADGAATAQVGTDLEVSSSGPTPATVRPASTKRPHHVVVVVFENKSRGQVLRGAGYFRALARHGANMLHSHAVTHPSQPNYLALFSGRLHGVDSDSCPHRFDARNLASQLIGHGFTFRAYSEDLPRRGSLVCRSDNGLYVRKHAPWTDFTTVPRRHSVPFSRFPTDFARLPTVSFVLPNLCHDMHDCPLAVGNHWLRTRLSEYVRWAQAHQSLLVVTFDEDDDTHANHIYTAIAGAGIEPGRYPQRITHYSVLRTLEGLYGLSPLGHARQAHPIRAIWR